ncbi:MULTISPECIES: hypothetical protein [Protofrankia]|uniref:CBS domain-containing protein n=1 Tax=Protofrankia coriariae TaxID=1562887 RepID=A0ABR5F3X8_9ACTN|nr:MULTISPECIES: hypothetical protein [Protofrankia]KLL11408.1 hypothetical protein FrCorBMG51_11690 [Protofrankia coriariae]ONH34319.1 hypothetical protein BL254_16585 [Protofrankia sp. BMG5.30]
MTRNKIVRSLAGVVELVDKVEPCIELRDTMTGGEAAREMRDANVQYARLVHLEKDLARSSIVTVGDLDRLSDPARPLLEMIDTFQPEIFLDWRDFLTDAVNRSLRGITAETTITVEDDGQPLGLLSAGTVQAFVAASRE